jgi:hypothetical protein
MNFMPMKHSADIYSKTTATSPAGQKKASWSLESESVVCAFLPKDQKVINFLIDKTYGYDQNLHFFFLSNANIDFSKRLKNIKNNFGEILEAGPIEITSIVKCPAPSGKINHIEVSGRRVIEE